MAGRWTTFVGGVCGITPTTGAAQLMLQLPIALAAPPLSAHLSQCPGMLSPLAMATGADMTPVWTTDRFIPSARKAPSNRPKTRRNRDMAISMARDRAARKDPHGPVTFRRAGLAPETREPIPPKCRADNGLRGSGAVRELDAHAGCNRWTRPRVFMIGSELRQSAKGDDKDG